MFYLPAEYFRHAAVRNAQLARDVAGPDALSRELDDLVAHEVGQRAPVDEVAAELVDAGAAVACGSVRFGSVFVGGRGEMVSSGCGRKCGFDCFGL